MTFGLTSTGFARKRLPDILNEIGDALKPQFGEVVGEAVKAGTSGDSFIGQFVGAYAEREALVWELAEAVYLQAFPDGAEGVPLDNVGAIVGVPRLGALVSTVTGTLTGTAATIVPAASVASVTGAGDRFTTTAAATLAALTAWAALTVYVAGDRRTNAIRCYVCTVPGTSAVSGGPTTTGTAIVDGTVTWRYLGEGTAAADVAMVSEQTGAITAPAFTLTTIETPVSGWQNVTNLVAAVPGRSLETDAAYRVRRANSLVIARGGTIAAIKTRLAEVTGVTFTGIRENRTSVTDGNGLPPHSIQAFVVGGTDPDVAAAIYATHAAGIETHGAVTVNVTDEFGVAQPIRFSRATEIPIYLRVLLTTDGTYPVNGNDLVKAELLSYASTLANGEDLLNWRLIAAIMEVPGILTVTIYQGTAPVPVSSANTPIAPQELATLASANIAFT